MAVSVDEIKILVKAETDKAIKNLKKLRTEGKKTSVGFKDIALGAVGFSGITTAINVASTAFRSAIKTIVDFDQAIANAGSVSSVTREELKELALEAGRNTKFSATQAADALYFLASAGIDSAEVMRDTLTPALNLAAAANIGIAEATDIAVNNMKVFNKEGLTATNTADIMAQTVKSANTDFRQLAEALKVSGADAALSGVKFQDLNVLIAALANQGIKGSEAGIKLRQTFIRLRSGLAPVTKTLAKYGVTQEEVNKLLPTPLKLFQRLREANISAGDATKIFGARQGAVFGLIKNNLGEFERLQDTIVGTGDAYKGAAEATAALQLDTISGQLALLKSAWDDIVLTLSGGGGFEEGAKDALKLLVQIVREIGNFVRLPAVLKTLKATLQGVVFGFKTVFALLKAIGRTFIVAFQPIIRFWEFIVRVAVGAFKAISESVNDFISFFRKQISKAGGFFKPLIDIIVGFGQTFTLVLSKYIVPFINTLLEFPKKFIEVYTKLISFLISSAENILPKAVTAQLENVLKASRDTLNSLISSVSGAVSDTVKDFTKLGADGIKIIKDLFAENDKLRKEDKKSQDVFQASLTNKAVSESKKRSKAAKEEADKRKAQLEALASGLETALGQLNKIGDQTGKVVIDSIGKIIQAVSSSKSQIEALIKVVSIGIDTIGSVIQQAVEANNNLVAVQTQLTIDNLEKVALVQANITLKRLEKEKEAALETLKFQSKAARELTSILETEEEERFKNLSEEEKKKILLQKQIDKEREELEAEHNEKIRKEKERIFRIEKEIAIAQSKIDEQQAISAIRQQYPFPWQNFEMNRLVKDTMSLYAQIRGLLSSTTPEFRNGVENFGGGVAKIHRDEEVFLPPGSTVRPASQVLSESRNDSSNAMMLNIENLSLSGIQDAKGLLMELTNLAEDMGQPMIARI
jgi:TP901 family phage tail tape measure protein